ncbi:hypothetical protein, partial [Actinomadura miaoliensis]|uniref:hypothetical protein n=1 Tax=Actinomadura miaoliensis TaxID=430685 RepID=UPI0031EBA84E
MTGEPAAERPLDDLTARLTRLTDLHEDPAAEDERDRLITALLGGLWVAACRDAAERDHPFLDDSEDEDAPAHAPRELAFALFAEEGEEVAARARAILTAARAARAHLHHGATGADRRLAEARRWWALSDPESDAAGTPADDLVDWLRGAPAVPLRSIRVPVLLHEGDPDELGVGALILDEVADDLSRVLPDPATMAFASARRVLDAGLGTAFAWARGREDAPAGTGVRWRLLTEAGTPALDAPGLEAGAAAAAGLAWLWRRSPIPKRWRRTGWPHAGSLVHARLDASGRLLPVPGLEDVAAGVVGRGVGLVVADQEAGRVRAAAGPPRRRVAA